MTDNKKNIDGFVRRKVGRQLGDVHGKPDKSLVADERPYHSGFSSRNELQSSSGKPIDRKDIDESLNILDSEDKPKNKKSWFKKKDKKQSNLEIKSGRKLKRFIKWTVITIGVILLAIAGYVGYKVMVASDNIFSGNILGIVRSEPLLTDAKGRSNFLVFGTAEDDEGGAHGGANLTDSIMVISVDQKQKNAFMVSLPRDLWVEYNETCSVGNQGRLNAVYFCASNDGEDEKVGAEALMSKVYEITGLEMQYYIHLNFTAVVEAVDAVGGVQVVIESEDPRGIFDDNFDWKCGFKCNMVKYPNGLTPVMDGEHALALARARGASGNTYGLPQANFDREKNQQKILAALREKALSAGTLTNLGAVTKLIDALGNNLRTNIDSKYIRTIMDIAKDTKSPDVISVSLVDPEDLQVSTGNAYGQSIVRPVKGLLDYTGIHNYLSKKITSDPVVREAAEIAVLNGSGIVGAAQTEATKLESENYIITTVENAPDTISDTYQVYQLDASKTKTAEKLAARYKVTVQTTKPTSISVPSTTSFIIVIGPAKTTP